MKKILFLVAVAACSKSGMGANVRTDIQARMESTSDPITACYASALKTNRKLRGMMVLDIAAAPDTGQFTDIVVRRDELGDPTMQSCVTAEVGKLKLATPQKTRSAFSYSINFQPIK
jgi:hypothetical protein